MEKEALFWNFAKAEPLIQKSMQSGFERYPVRELFFETWIDFYTLAWQKIQLVLNLAHLWWNETRKYIWSTIFVFNGSFEKCWQRSRKRRDTLKKYFFLQRPIDFKVVKGQIFWSSNNLWSFLSCFIYRQNGRTPK